jgi:hypothetical protein
MFYRNFKSFISEALMSTSKTIISFNRGAENYCQPRPPLFLFLFSTAGMEKTDERQIKGVDPTV